MRKSVIRLAIAVAGVLFVAATAAKFTLNMLVYQMPNFGACRSAQETKRRGTWVCDVEPVPRQYSWRGHDIEFQEVWVEEVAAPEPYLVWFTYYRRTGQKYLCFRLGKGRELFPVLQMPLPRFQLEGQIADGFAIDFSNGDPGTFFEQSDHDFPFPVKMGVAAVPMEPAASYDITLEVRARK
jgi:hypothetical protein